SVWMATASANTPRSQPLSTDIGRRKFPSAERGPKAIMEIRQPHTTMIASVRGSIRGAERLAGEAGLCIASHSSADSRPPITTSWHGSSASREVDPRSRCSLGLRRAHASPHPHVAVSPLAVHPPTCYIGFARNEDNWPIGRPRRLLPDVFVPEICSL